MMTEQHSDEERLPLTVVVKRSMVKLPESLERSGSSHDQQQLITCQTCDICVHKCECKYVIVCVLYSNYMARSMSIKSRFQMEVLNITLTVLLKQLKPLIYIIIHSIVVICTWVLRGCPICNKINYLTFNLQEMLPLNGSQVVPSSF